MDSKFNLKDFKPLVAFFGMGIYAESYLPTYSGGLEILNGDIIRTCADQRIPVVGVFQSSSSGYFRQRMTPNGDQIEEPIYWDPHSTLETLSQKVTIKNEGRDLEVSAVLYPFKSKVGRVPVLLLDTNSSVNREDDRHITGKLYSNEQRVQQENVLGIGGIKLLRELWGDSIDTYHMNEGHAAFLTLGLLEAGHNLQYVKDHCVFTTHTPVHAGHEAYDYDTIQRVLSRKIPQEIRAVADHYGKLHMTKLGANLSRYVNAVSQKNRDVCKSMDIFKGMNLDYITNGVHPATWASEEMADLFDSHFSNWKTDSRALEDIVDHVPDHEVLDAKDDAKRKLICWVNSIYPVKFEQDAITIVWARRFAEYKRPGLILEAMDHLRHLAERYNTKIQLVFAGKAHPSDEVGKGILKHVYTTIRDLKNNSVRLIFVENYDTKIAKRLLAGADVWLNTPRRPLEACGTSGMKALFNGCMNLSTYDGWYVEGDKIDPDALFIFGPKRNQLEENRTDDHEDLEGLKERLTQIVELYSHKDEVARRIKLAIRLAPDFSCERNVKELAAKSWKIPVWKS